MRSSPSEPLSFSLLWLAKKPKSDSQMQTKDRMAA